MSGTRISKHNPIEVDGVSAAYDIYKTETGYTFSAYVGGGFRPVLAARGFFAKPTSGGVDKRARALVEGALRVLIAQSHEEFVYVVVSDMPGFAQKRLSAHLRAGYAGLAKGGPRYVVRCDSHEQADAIVAEVEAIGTIVDGSRSFSPKVIDVTNHALVALDGSTRDANDAITYIAAQRAEDAVIDAPVGG